MKILSRDSPQRIFIKGERVLVFLPLSTLLRLLPRFMPKFLRCYVAKERKEKSGSVRESRKSPENEIHGECAVNYSTIGSKLTMGTVRFDAGDSQKGFLFVKIFNLLNLLKFNSCYIAIGANTIVSRIIERLEIIERVERSSQLFTNLENTLNTFSVRILCTEIKTMPKVL